MQGMRCLFINRKSQRNKQLEMTLLKSTMGNPNSLSNTKRTAMTTQHKNNQDIATSVDKAVGSDAASQSNHKRKRYQMKPLDEKRYSYMPSPDDKHPFVKKDYLVEQRVKYQDIEKPETNKIEMWQSDVSKNKMNDHEKISYIQLKSSQIDEEVSRKEKMMKICNSSSIDDTKKMNGILIDSIKTKLSLLNDLN